METETQSHGRRRFFRRAGIIGLIGAASAGIGLKAYAHGGWRRGEPLSEAQIDRMLQHLYIEIDATEEQKRRLGPIAKDAARELQPLREKWIAARKQAVALLTAERVDAQALESLRAEQMRLAEDASQRITRALADAAQVLTPAQRQDIAARLERRRRHHWG